MKKIKLFELIKIKFTKVVESRVSDFDKLKFQIEKLEDSKNEIEDSYFKSKGKVKYYNDLKIKIDSKIDELLRSAKKVVDDDSLLIRFKKEIDRLRNQKEIIENQINLTTKISQKLYEQKNILLSNLSDMKSKYDELKTKSEFSKDVDLFMENMTTGNEYTNLDMSDVKKEIEITYNSKNIKLDEMTKDIDDISIDLNKVDDFEDFKNELKDLK